MGRLSRRSLLTGAATLGLGTFAAACAPSSPGPGPAPPPSAGPAAADLRALFDRTAMKLMAPGAVMMLRTPDGELAHAYGVRSVGGTEPVALGDHVRIGSITKTFTGTVILKLAQEGRIDLDGPVARFRPDVPNGQHITITQLLNMRSGLYNYSESLELNKALDEDPNRVYPPEQLLAMGLRGSPYFPPGTGYHYSNTNTVLLGLIAEQIEKRPLGEIYLGRLFEPLAMRDTSFATTSNAIPPPYPRGYMYGTNVSTMDGEGLPPEQREAAYSGQLKPNDVTDENPSWTWAAGGGISTIRDLATWATALTDGSLLDPAWQRRRLDSIQPVDPANPNSPGYGLGLARFGPMYGHTGELPGYQSFCGSDPRRRNTLAVWANLNAAPDGHAVASTIAQQLIGQIYA